MNITRKSFFFFVTIAATTTAALGAAAASADEAQNSWEPAWNDEADIIVVGFGGSGVVATIAGIDAGASVITLEKAPSHEGGNMACSGGQLHEVSEDVDAWWDMYVAGSYGGNADERTTKAYIGFVNQLPAWFEDHGIDVSWKETPGDGHKTPVTYLMGSIEGYDGTTGLYLYTALEAAAMERNADVRTSTRAKRLVQNPFTKEIVGVIAEDAQGNELAFKAHKGVILACGGYENNPEIMYNYFQPGVRFFPGGTPYNTGDGIKMATEVGAYLWHMGLLEYNRMAYRVPSEIAGFGLTQRFRTTNAFMYVNGSGNRFCNEMRSIVHSHPNIEEFGYDDKAYTFPNLPMFLIFDQTAFEAENPLWTLNGGYPMARLTADPDASLGIEWPSNDAAVEQGWIFKGDTIEELAAAIKGSSFDGELNGIDPDALRATLEAYNAACEAGEDPAFGRAGDKLEALVNPPFYAIELANGVMNSNGGPMRNEYAQTLNAFGEAIPRLYNTGEFGSFNALVYNFGNLVEACTSGHVAAEHIATLESWDK